MLELIKKIIEIPDAYDDFVLSVIAYAKLKSEHVDAILGFLKENEVSSASDVVYFIMSQPDFSDCCETSRRKRAQEG